MVNTPRGRGSVGRASPCQGEGRRFESGRPLGAKPPATQGVSSFSQVSGRFGERAPPGRHPGGTRGHHSCSLHLAPDLCPDCAKGRGRVEVPFRWRRQGPRAGQALLKALRAGSFTSRSVTARHRGRGGVRWPPEGSSALVASRVGATSRYLSHADEARRPPAVRVGFCRDRRVRSAAETFRLGTREAHLAMRPSTVVKS